MHGIQLDESVGIASDIAEHARCTERVLWAALADWLVDPQAKVRRLFFARAGQNAHTVRVLDALEAHFTPSLKPVDGLRSGCKPRVDSLEFLNQTDVRLTPKTLGSMTPIVPKQCQHLQKCVCSRSTSSEHFGFLLRQIEIVRKEQSAVLNVHRQLQKFFESRPTEYLCGPVAVPGCLIVPGTRVVLYPAFVQRPRYCRLAAANASGHRTRKFIARSLSDWPVRLPFATSCHASIPWTPISQPSFRRILSPLLNIPHVVGRRTTSRVLARHFVSFAALEWNQEIGRRQASSQRKYHSNGIQKSPAHPK